MCILELNQQELENFNKLNQAELPIWVGRNPRQWANQVELGLGDANQLPMHAFGRKEVEAYWADRRNSTLSCLLTTMAWGGMTYGNARGAFLRGHEPAGLSNEAMAVIERIRNGELNRQSAYAEFKQLRERQLLPNIGPAYFTKIIFFAHPAHNGYILDQWTARSMHILTMQTISQQCGHCPEKVEERLFSSGGHNPHAWRRYVMTRWMDYGFYAAIRN